MPKFSLFVAIVLLLKSITCFAQDAHSLDLEAGAKLYQQKCASCHGEAGAPAVATFPKLAGQGPHYLRKELLDYQSNRINAAMTPLAKTLTEADMENLVAYMQTFKANYGAVASNLRARGEQLYRAGDAQKHIPACGACHSPEGVGNDEARFPHLAGQNAAYVVQQLQAFAAGDRNNDPHGMMRDIASRLSPQDQQAVASFINGLQPGH